MARILPPPQFPVAPAEYKQDYANSVVRTFQVFIQQFLSPGEGRNTNLTLTGLQEDAFGLETGALFQQDGFVKIVTINRSHPRGVSATGNVGSVTVTV
tara:strand:+ start:370 stop:663 length:294 start_codon:yes stop_codon:yes gene_type:complete